MLGSNLSFKATALLMLPHWGAGVNLSACVHFARVRFALVDWLLATTALLMLPHWGAGVNLSACVHFARVRFALWDWLLATTALLMLPRWGAGVNLSACMHFAHVRFALVHWLLCDHCAANVATLGGRSKPERLYAFCACAFCIALWDWLLATIALLMLLHWGAGVNLSASMHFAHVRFALVHWLLCDHCAANVATLGGRSKPEGLYAFCACAFCIALWDWLLAAIALLMLLHWGAGVNLSACMHFAHVRFALVHWLLCDHCAADVATVGGRSKPERLCAFCACAFCVGALATCDHCAADVAALGGRSKPERLYAFCACVFCIGALATCDHCAADVAASGGRSKPERLYAFCACAFCVGALGTCDHCAADVAALGGRSRPERLYAFCACAFCIGGLATCDHRAAIVATLGGRSKPERLCAFCACAFCVCALLLVATALLMLPQWGAGPGWSEPERVCAFCVCAVLFVTTALLMLPHWGAGVYRNACVHFASVHCCL